MIKVLQDKEVAGAYALWSFLPNEHHLGLFFYETLRDLYLKIQNLNRPELNVRGMAFAFHTETAGKKDSGQTYSAEKTAPWHWH